MLVNDIMLFYDLLIKWNNIVDIFRIFECCVENENSVYELQSYLLSNTKPTFKHRLFESDLISKF